MYKCYNVSVFSSHHLLTLSACVPAQIRHERRCAMCITSFSFTIALNMYAHDIWINAEKISPSKYQNEVFFVISLASNKKTVCYSIVIARSLTQAQARVASHFIPFGLVCFHFMRIPSADTKAKSKRSWPLQYSSRYLWASFLSIHSCECVFFLAIHSQFLISPCICASLKEFFKNNKNSKKKCVAISNAFIASVCDAVWIPVKFATWKCWTRS